MPADNPIVRHWQTELKVFDQNLVLLKNQLSADAIHDLRVAVKKLRSYLKLWAALFNKKHAKDSFETTNQLFSTLGKHRNIEISKQLLPSFINKNQRVPKPLLVYLHLLQEQVAPYCQQAIQEYDRNILDELTKQLEQETEKLVSQDLENRVKQLILSSFENIEEYLKHFQKKSHLIRKRLKDIFYWLKILPDEFVFAKPDTKTIDKILDHLGNIQDHEMLTTNLKSFRKIILSDSHMEYDLIKVVEGKVKKKKESLLKKAHAMTEDLVFKIHEKEKAS